MSPVIPNYFHGDGVDWSACPSLLVWEVVDLVLHALLFGLGTAKVFDLTMSLTGSVVSSSTNVSQSLGGDWLLGSRQR